MKLSPYVTGARNSDIREWTNYIQERNAINLAQGICHIEPSEEKRQAVASACEMVERGLTQSGYNSYAHYSGIPELRRVIAAKAKGFNGLDVDADSEILVTNGASGAFNCAVHAIAQAGEEVILFEPLYTYHIYLLRIHGFQPRTVRLRPPAWSFTIDDLEAAYSEKTRAIVVNSPANPTGKVFSCAELRIVAQFCEKHDLWAITDEVYEFMTFDGLSHVSLAALPGMWERTVTLNSFSKPLGLTGWRVGYSIAPREITQAMGYFNEYAYVCAPTPLQRAIATAFENWRAFEGLRRIYQHKRDILCKALHVAEFPYHEPKGAFYVLVDVSRLGLEDGEAANRRLIDKPKIGGVPAHDFYTDGSGKQQIRFCYAVEDRVLQDAAERLSGLA